MTIVKTATEARTLKSQGKKYQFSESVAVMMANYLRFYGVFSHDKPETVRFYLEKLVVDSMNFPGSLSIYEVLHRFVNSAETGLYGKEIKSPEKALIQFREWINDGDRRQRLFDDIEGKRPERKQHGRSISEFSNDEVAEQYRLIRMMRLDQPDEDDNMPVTKKKKAYVPNLKGYVHRLIQEVERRGLTDAT
jgi:hypothetical protein